uniref:Transcription factor TRI6 n=1 Tax=Fusarium sporotrichioides TaxID=5514 RepID=Q9UWE5_FUSSP|nr:transcription factor TRI6 [Fusarium sporotrichioides]
MIYMASESHYGSWSALPLFDRVASPDHATTDFVPDLIDYESPTFEVDLLSENYDYADFFTYSLPTADPTKTSLHEEPLCFEVDFTNPATDHYITTSSGLLDAVPSQLIALPSFTKPSKCPFPGCKSTTIFESGRDFRRHYRQHFKRFFCRYPECSQSTQDILEVGTKGFATRKDRARHESKHKPTVRCPWHDQEGQQCLRVFSRVDNMRDHYRRIHKC